MGGSWVTASSRMTWIDYKPEKGAVLHREKGEANEQSHINWVWSTPLMSSMHRY